MKSTSTTVQNYESGFSVSSREQQKGVKSAKIKKTQEKFYLPKKHWNVTVVSEQVVMLTTLTSRADSSCRPGFPLICSNMADSRSNNSRCLWTNEKRAAKTKQTTLVLASCTLQKRLFPVLNHVVLLLLASPANRTCVVGPIPKVFLAIAEKPDQRQ